MKLVNQEITLKKPLEALQPSTMIGLEKNHKELFPIEITGIRQKVPAYSNKATYVFIDKCGWEIPESPRLMLKGADKEIQKYEEQVKAETAEAKAINDKANEVYSKVKYVKADEIWKEMGGARKKRTEMELPFVEPLTTYVMQSNYNNRGISKWTFNKVELYGMRRKKCYYTGISQVVFLDIQGWEVDDYDMISEESVPLMKEYNNLQQKLQKLFRDRSDRLDKLYRQFRYITPSQLWTKLNPKKAKAA